MGHFKVTGSRGQAGKPHLAQLCPGQGRGTVGCVPDWQRWFIHIEWV